MEIRNKILHLLNNSPLLLTINPYLDACDKNKTDPANNYCYTHFLKFLMTSLVDPLFLVIKKRTSQKIIIKNDYAISPTLLKQI